MFAVANIKKPYGDKGPGAEGVNAKQRSRDAPRRASAPGRRGGGECRTSRAQVQGPQ